MESRSAAAMDFFETGWRAMLRALRRIERGDIACEANEEKELVDLQMRFAHTIAKHCAYASGRNERCVQRTRAFLYDSLEKVARSTELGDLLQVYLNLHMVLCIGKTTHSCFMRWLKH